MCLLRVITGVRLSLEVAYFQLLRDCLLRVRLAFARVARVEAH
jgi:hypothetical protein